MTGMIGLIFRGGIALNLMSFFTFITAIYIFLKYLNEKYENKFLKLAQTIFRLGLLSIGSLCALILILVTIPQFTCEKVSDETKEADHMIVLGAGLKNGDQLSYMLRTRLEKAMEVFKKNPKLKIIVSGGQGKDELLTEAEAMKIYLIKHGIPEDQIILEDQARSTYENLLFSQRKLKSSDNQKIIILSSNFHIFRANFIARRLGLDPIVICSPVYLALKANYMIREIPAIVNDFFGNVLK